MRLRQTGRAVLLMGVVMVASAGGDSFWNRHNFATTHRRSPGWSLPQQEGGRRSIFARIWEDASPNNPFLPQRPPTPPPIRPQLSENDFIMEDAYDDDDDDATDLLWLPQTRFGKPDHHQDSTSLEGLQHLLEGEVNPVHRPTKVDQVGLEETATQKGDVGTTHNKQTEHRQHLGHGFDPFRSGSGRLDGQALDHTRHHLQLPLINQQHFHRQGILSQDHLSKDVPHDYHGHLSLPEQLTNHKHFSQDFISHTPQLLQEYDHSDAFSGDLLTSHRHSQILPQHELFPTNLFGDGRQFPGSFRKHDIFSSVDRQDFPDHVTIPEPFMNHHTFEDFTHQQPFVEQQQFRELQTSPHEDPAGVLPEDEGPAWLPSALSGLNLPSSKDLISVFTNPELTKEGHREACHARNLHTCGTRVIDEFSHEPGYQETCRIREEFLDCMEQQRGKPCHLHGERFSRDGTKLIRDRIKTLLWSARGCILGHSA